MNTPTAGSGGGHPPFRPHTDDLSITRVFSCVARRVKACASFMFAGCCWWRSLAAGGGSGASRWYVRNAYASHDAYSSLRDPEQRVRARSPAGVLVRHLLHRTDCCRSIPRIGGVNGCRRSQPPLTPYRRRITIGSSLEGALCTFPVMSPWTTQGNGLLSRRGR